MRKCFAIKGKRGRKERTRMCRCDDPLWLLGWLAGPGGLVEVACVRWKRQAETSAVTLTIWARSSTSSRFPWVER